VVSAALIRTERADRTSSDLGSRMSHELRAPLSDHRLFRSHRITALRPARLVEYEEYAEDILLRSPAFSTACSTTGSHGQDRGRPSQSAA